MKQYPTPHKYTVQFPEKYAGDVNNVVMRSSWERKFAVWCDYNPSVIKWSSEPFPISYWSKAHGKQKRYFIDFIVMLKASDGTTKKLAVEIKPAIQTRPPEKKKGKRKERYLSECLTYQQNMDKWEAAKAWCQQHEFIFTLLTENELGV